MGENGEAGRRPMLGCVMRIGDDQCGTGMQERSHLRCHFRREIDAFGGYDVAPMGNIVAAA